MMDAQHILDPDQARIATAAGLGSFVFLMVTRNLGWVFVITLFLVGQLTAYYFTIPIAMWRGWSTQTYGVVGFTIGATAMALWNVAVKLLQNLLDDPVGTLTFAWRLWRGGSVQPNGNKPDRPERKVTHDSPHDD